MEVFAGEWLNLLIRWAHMVVAIGWIGTSFYFMALDYGLDTRERKSADPHTRSCCFCSGSSEGRLLAAGRRVAHRFRRHRGC